MRSSCICSNKDNKIVTFVLYFVFPLSTVHHNKVSPKKLNMNASSSESYITEDDADVTAEECMKKMDKANKGGRKKKN